MVMLLIINNLWNPDDGSFKDGRIQYKHKYGSNGCLFCTNADIRTPTSALSLISGHSGEFIPALVDAASAVAQSRGPSRCHRLVARGGWGHVTATGRSLHQGLMV